MNRIATAVITLGTIATAGLAVSAPAFASQPIRTAAAQTDLVSQAVPTVGVGVQLLDLGPAGAPNYSRPDTYIGRTNDGLLPAPFAPGSSRVYHITFSNAGNIAESLSITQTAAAYLGGPAVPASWVSFSPSSVKSLAPGASITVPVTVTVPAGTKAGTWIGVVTGSGSAPGSGNVKLVTGASIREYITVS